MQRTLKNLYKSNFLPCFKAPAPFIFKSPYLSLSHKKFYNFSTEPESKVPQNLAEKLDNATALFHERNYTESLRLFHECLRSFKEHGLEQDLDAAYAHFIVSRIHHEKNEHEQAVIAGEKAFKISEKAEKEYGMLNQLSVLTSILGISYMKLKNYDKAEEYLRKCLHYKLRSEEPQLVIGNYHEILGQCLLKNGKTQEALDHFMQAAELLSVNKKELSKLGSVYYEIGEVYLSLGQKEDALNYYTKAIENKAFEKNAVQQAYAASKAGLLAAKIKQQTLAKDLSNKAIEIATQCPADQTVLAVYSNIEQIYKELGQPLEALNVFKGILSSLPENSIAVNQILKSITYMLAGVGTKQQDINFLRDLISAHIKKYGENSPQLVFYYHHLANFDKNAMRYNEALDAYKKAIDSASKHSQNRVHVIPVLLNLSDLYYLMGKYELALDTTYEAIDLVEKYFKGNHPDIILVYNHAGTMFRNMGGHKESVEQFEKALTATIEKYGQDDLTTALAYIHMGQALSGAKRHADAFDFIKVGLGTIERIKGNKTIEYGQGLIILSNTLSELGKHSDALKTVQEAVRLLEEVEGPSHPDLINAYINLATKYNKSRNIEGALLTYNKALEICLKYKGIEDVSTARIHDEIGKLFLEESNLKLAEENLKKAFEIKASILGKDHPETQKTSKILNELYGLSGKRS